MLSVVQVRCTGTRTSCTWSKGDLHMGGDDGSDEVMCKSAQVSFRAPASLPSVDFGCRAA